MRRFSGDIGWVPPMLADRWDRPREDPAWSYEIKYDGIRVIACADSGAVRLYSRTGRDLTSSFDEMTALADRLRVRRAILDGELVALGEDGLPCFTSVMRRLWGRRRLPRARLYLFDALVWGEDDLRGEELQLRRWTLLTGGEWGGVVQYSPSVGGELGADLLQRADLLGFEGVMAKRRDSPYVHGRSDAWRKVRLFASGRVLIGGMTGQGQVSLLVGVFDGEGLRYLGRVAVPGSHPDLEELASLRRDHSRRNCPFIGCGAEADWVEPITACRVRYAEVTPAGGLRHPVFGGLLPVPVQSCLWSRLERNRALRPPETEAPGDFRPERVLAAMGIAGRTAEGTASVAGRSVSLTNLGKVLWPEVPLTKGELIAYYRIVAGGLLEYIRGRPLKVTRHPDGPSGEGFFQRRLPPNSPPWLRTVEVEGRRYLLCDDVATLMWLINSAAFEIHPLPFHHGEEGSNLLILDLDPALPAGLAEACRAAILVEQLLMELGVSSWVKTSGGRGIHVAVALQPGCSAGQVTSLAQILGRILVRTRGDLFTLERSRIRRRGRVYVDYLQNRPGATVIAPYCVRPRRGAPVSTPVTWDEMYGFAGRRLPVFTPEEVVHRFRKRGDPWRDLLETRHSVAEVLRGLRERYDGR
ncbi:MAG: DNA ligase D [Bacillota bacterium]